MGVILIGNEVNQKSSNYLPVGNVCRVTNNCTSEQCHFAEHPNHPEKGQGLPALQRDSLFLAGPPSPWLQEVL